VFWAETPLKDGRAHLLSILGMTVRCKGDTAGLLIIATRSVNKIVEAETKLPEVVDD
jgi:hypothetical protein